MKNILTTLTFVCFLFSFSVSQTADVIEWQTCLGGSMSEETQSIFHTNDGGFIIAGFTASNDDDVSGYHGGTSDCWIVKLSAMGNLEWQKTYGGSVADYASSIVQTNDGGYIFAGTTSSNDGDVSGNHGVVDVWVVKLDGQGGIEWQKCFGGTDEDFPASIVQTSEGGFIVAGVTNSNNGDVSGNHGANDYWVVKLDVAGSIQWQRCFGGTGFDNATSIIQTNDAGYILTGFSVSNDGDVIGNHGMDDYWIIKLDSLGSLQWQKSMGGTATDRAYSIVQTLSGGYLVTGQSNSVDGDVSNNIGDNDIWLTSLNSSGSILWQKSLGGTKFDGSTSLVITNDGNYVIGGTTMSENGDVTLNHGVNDYWILKLDTSGNLLWQISLGGTDRDYFSQLVASSDGGIAIAGTSASLNGDVTNNHSALGIAWPSDYWIVKLISNVNTIRGKVFIDLNNNLVQDSGENSIPNIALHETTRGRLSFSGRNGEYNLSTLDSGNFIVSPGNYNNYIAVPVLRPVYFSGIDQIDSLNDFALQGIGTINDLRIKISPSSAFRPGFNAIYKIQYENIGTTSLPGSIVFYPASGMTFVSSLPSASSVSLDSIVWQLPLINPLDAGEIVLTVHLSPALSIGTIVAPLILIEPSLGDETPGNNRASWEVVLTGSLDPNDILVNRSRIGTNELSSSPDLEYLIRFQNTGTDTAFTVLIKNYLPDNTDSLSFEFIDSSHPVTLSYINKQKLIWFQFNNILLPDSNRDEAMSHGYVRYRIKPFTSLLLGDSIQNNASIYFDFNDPVNTNTVLTEIVAPVSVYEKSNDQTFLIYPNPVTGDVRIVFEQEKASIVQVIIGNAVGQIIRSLKENIETTGMKAFSFSTADLLPGIYYITIISDGKKLNRKLIKM